MRGRTLPLLHTPVGADFEAGPWVRTSPLLPLSNRKERRLTNSTHSRRSSSSLFRPRRRYILIIFIIIVVVIVCDIRGKTWRGPVYIFDKKPRPKWLDSPYTTKSLSKEPLILRVAVISHPSELERRRAIRDSIFRGVPSHEIQFDYRFFLGVSEDMEDGNGGKTNSLYREAEKYKDMVILKNIPETYDRIAQKRFAALKWASRSIFLADTFSNTTYDYFMTLDSDTFVRFKALARRFSVIMKNHKNVNPREQAIMIGRMKYARTYWLNAMIDDEDANTLERDIEVYGPRYKYPVGIGYMLSSFLVKTLLSIEPPVPHHIEYPKDDVMIGFYVASLKHYPKHNSVYRYGHPWNIFSTRVYPPRNLLPRPIDTLIIDDNLGWHDFPGRKYGHKFEGSVGWDSVCVHHIKTEEFYFLRNMKEFQGEWEMET
ncbi:hypothetical protein Clacol_001065 [Clathrus columnatus]|uniref:Hexosyltransferase n=1 Tax=Clathrus columnatus TaxID=1419009 RepID=A0AAV4ZXL9_9AGAM|nr:hypothetical protein Clacol_001065 [Clathrus columnatus]